MSRDDVSFMENHFITAMAAALLGLGGWNIYTTSELKTDQQSNYQELTGEIKLQTAKIDFLKQSFTIRTLDRYTSTDASRDKTQLMSEINMLKLQINSIKSDVNEIKHNGDIQ